VKPGVGVDGGVGQRHPGIACGHGRKPCDFVVEVDVECPRRRLAISRLRLLQCRLLRCHDVEHRIEAVQQAEQSGRRTTGCMLRYWNVALTESSTAFPFGRLLTLNSLTQRSDAETGVFRTLPDQVTIGPIPTECP